MHFTYCMYSSIIHTHGTADCCVVCILSGSVLYVRMYVCCRCAFDLCKSNVLKKMVLGVLVLLCSV